MKKLFPVFLLLSIVSCKKTETNNTKTVDSTKIIDSINVIRQKINDIIRTHNRYKDWEGSHVLTHGMINGKGKIDFTKIGKDEYQIKGSLQNGKNFVKIEGTGYMASERHLSFEGSIKQSLEENDNGKLDLRKGRKTFLSKDGGKTFRLQESLNSSGFVDHIDIKF